MHKLKPTLIILVLLSITFYNIQSSTNFQISKMSDIELKTSMINLVGELRKFNTSAQNNFLLSKVINQTYDTLKYVANQLYAYNNVIIGSNNTITGFGSLLIGNYDNITGGNNFVFVSNYAGSIDGDLVIQNWKVQLDKRYLTVLYPEMIVSVLTQRERQVYGGYVGTYQPSMTNVLCLVDNIINVVDVVSGETTVSNTSEQQQQVVSNITQQQQIVSSNNSGLSSQNTIVNSPTPSSNTELNILNTNFPIPSVIQSPSPIIITSMLPQFITPSITINNPSTPTQNLRTDSSVNISTKTNQQSNLLSLSILNNSWLPF